MIIIKFLCLGIILYVCIGLLTVLYKRKEVNEFARILAPKFKEELDAQTLMSLESADISVEQTTRLAGYFFCFAKWPSAIHSNLLEEYNTAQEKKDV